MKKFEENLILEKKVLGKGIKYFRIYSSKVSRNCQAGQFVIVKIGEKGERIPLTICDWNREKATISLVVQEIGKTTHQLGKMEPGDIIPHLLGPLGKPSEIEYFGKVVCVGGGVGVAEIYPIARALKERENEVLCIIGARSKDLIILEEELKEISDYLYVTTDDGSYGRKGMVTEVLKEIIRETKVDCVFAVGPLVMMKAVSELTKPLGIPTKVSLNPIMVDGTGMCGSCRVKVWGEVKFACVDGPEFDGHGVDFEELILRNQRFLEKERLSLEIYLKKGGGDD